MIEAHRVPRLCLPPLTTGSAQCSGLKNTRERWQYRARTTVLCCWLERVSHLIVYPPSLSPSSCAWTAPQKQGDDECSSLSVAEHNFHKMPTIFTKCPQSNVFCFHKILLLTPVSLQIWFLFISDFRLNPLSVRTHFVKFQQYQLSGLCIIVFFQTNYSNSGDSPCRQSCFQRFR